MIFNFATASNREEARTVMDAYREARALHKARRKGSRVDDVLVQAPRMASKITSILRRQGRKIAAQVMEAYSRVAKIDEEEIIAEIMRHIALEGVSTDIIEEITPAIRAAYRSAHAHAVAEIEIDAGAEALQHADVAAIAWAEQHAAELVTQISESTRDDIAGLVGDALTEGWSAAKLGDAIEQSQGFSQYRSDMIARTELAYAHVQGNLDGYRSTGVERKRWITGAGSCDDCFDLDGVVIDIDDDFDYVDGPVDGPPAHPHCRCDIEPVEPEPEPQSNQEED